ncbi:MAG TPA: Crp/Fnr family transcriptional regulator [Blastocatellia bacterium]|nr:Crp/Fnr family transcriptional regulator [Blastocatellia bacterium]
MPVPEEESVVFDLIRSQGIARTFRPNIELFQQGTVIEEVFVLERGMVKMARTEYSGKEMIIEISEPVQVLGALSILSQLPSAVTATTLTPCGAFSLYARSFLSFIEREPALTKALLKRISRYCCEQIVRQSQLGMTSSRYRLAHLLMNYVSLGIPIPGGRVKINIPLKKSDLAGLLAIRPEQLSRLLAELRNEGVIEQERGWIIVNDLEQLSQVAEG